MSTQTPARPTAFDKRVDAAANELHRTVHKHYDRLTARPEFYTFRSAVLAEVARRINDETPF